MKTIYLTEPAIPLQITATVLRTVGRIQPSRITAMEEGCPSCQLALINDIEGEGQSA
ncbi:rCG22345 [Rattus norvegicus]|uniref:RCG22345 n=1 Tax=Rattus norvegicus TaxID=10116 RepID=A6INQ0_RAT|nr:rCG22345 [Rattus norvegicus]